ncbi:MAG: methyltransferase domain-containing protein [Rhodospirillales bacterium]
MADHQDDFWRDPVFVPCYIDLTGFAVSLIPRPRDVEFALLQLGAGSGRLAASIATAFPKARLTLMEANGALLARARDRLGDNAARCEFIESNWMEEPLPGGQDVISTMLALEPMDGEERADLYIDIFAALNRFGMVILAENVAGGSPGIDFAYSTVWREQVTATGGDAALIERRVNELSLLPLPTLDEHIAAIGKAGFAEASCWYKNLGFTLVSGVRPI